MLRLKADGILNVAPRAALTDEYRSAIRAELEGLMLALRAEAEPGLGIQSESRSSKPLMTSDEGDTCIPAAGMKPRSRPSRRGLRGLCAWVGRCGGPG